MSSIWRPVPLEAGFGTSCLLKITSLLSVILRSTSEMQYALLVLEYPINNPFLLLGSHFFWSSLGMCVYASKPNTCRWATDGWLYAKPQKVSSLLGYISLCGWEHTLRSSLPRLKTGWVRYLREACFWLLRQLFYYHALTHHFTWGYTPPLALPWFLPIPGKSEMHRW